jgi:hypothetical protein
MMKEPQVFNEEAFKAALKKLAETPREKSNTQRIYELLPDIEASLDAGVQYAEIIKVLAGIGFELSPRAFGSALYRARQRKAEKGQ